MSLDRLGKNKEQALEELRRTKNRQRQGIDSMPINESEKKCSRKLVEKDESIDNILEPNFYIPEIRVGISF